MTDQRFTELLGKQLAGEISADESIELNSILANNAALNKEYHLLQTYLESETEEEENIDVVFNRIKSQIQTPQAPQLKIIKSKNLLWLKIAAAVLVTLGIVLLYKREAFFSDQADHLVLVKVHTKAADIRTITLGDGSVVKINSTSKFRYPKKFSGHNRNVYLSGEAFFDVKKDLQHPFIVHTEKMDVQVLGTAFNVKIYPNDAFAETTLIRGKVVISLNQDKSQQFTLKPNDKFTLTNGKASLSQSDGEGVTETAWTNRELIFKNDRFDEVAKLFERHYDIKIAFKDPDLKKLTFTAHFTKENITEALNALKFIENFNYSIKGKNVYIFR
ncbi:FecR family protein [Pedobacter sp. N23S346]|uniref:FecR family protein n=1 Tax=Pedobacter sp. N23S346 TaxID=3402750 RepID=UPI003AD42845